MMESLHLDNKRKGAKAQIASHGQSKMLTTEKATHRNW
jgi:hypothetical protein